jgi:hypothetical protein
MDDDRLGLWEIQTDLGALMEPAANRDYLRKKASAVGSRDMISGPAIGTGYGLVVCFVCFLNIWAKAE